MLMDWGGLLTMTADGALVTFVCVSYSLVIAACVWEGISTANMGALPAGRRKWELRYSTSALMILGSSFRLAEFASKVTGSCGAQEPTDKNLVRLDAPCAKVSWFFNDFGMVPFFASKVLLFVVLYELRVSVDNDPKREPMRQRVRKGVVISLAFWAALLFVTSIIDVKHMPRSHNISWSRQVTLVVQSVALVLGAFAGVFVAKQLGWRLLSIRETGSSRRVVARVIFASVVCFASFVQRGVINIFGFADDKWTRTYFSSIWIPWILFVFEEVVPSILVLWAIGSLVRSTFHTQEAIIVASQPLRFPLIVPEPRANA